MNHIERTFIDAYCPQDATSRPRLKPKRVVARKRPANPTNSADTAGAYSSTDYPSPDDVYQDTGAATARRPLDDSPARDALPSCRASRQAIGRQPVGSGADQASSPAAPGPGEGVADKTGSPTRPSEPVVLAVRVDVVPPDQELFGVIEDSSSQMSALVLPDLTDDRHIVQSSFVSIDEAARQREEELERERAETLRLEAESRRREQERLEIEARRLEEERLEVERKEAERREQQRLEKEKLEQERQRIEAERKEAERQEQQRLEQEKLEQERQRIEAERKEAERQEQQRLEKQKLEQERQRIEAEKKEAERREQQRLEQVKLEQERLRIEAERKEAESREKERLEKERLERERQRIVAERIEAERREKERLEKDRLERERQRIEAERKEAESREKERLEKERLERERQRIVAERKEAESREKERLEKERLERERQRVEAERKEAERREKERLEQETQVAAIVEEETHDGIAAGTGLAAEWEVDEFCWPRASERLYASERAGFGPMGERLAETSREGVRVLAVTGSQRGEGRTTLAVCLARCAASSGLRVALVDADRERPQLGETLGVDASSGWPDAVLNDKPLGEAAVLSLRDGIMLFPLNDVASRKMRLDDRRVTEMMGKLAAEFDLVVVDAGPVADETDDFFEPGDNNPVDAVIVVRDLRSATEEEVEQTVGLLRNHGIQAIGIADNFDAPLPAENAA